MAVRYIGEIRASTRRNAGIDTTKVQLSIYQTVQ